MNVSAMATYRRPTYVQDGDIVGLLRVDIERWWTGR